MVKLVSAAATAALILTLGTAPSFAQAAAGAVPPAATPYAAADVDPAAPFGQIDVAAVDLSQPGLETWAKTLTDEQKAELNNRCGVINDASNVERYQEQGKSFCTAWMTLMAPGEMPVPADPAPVAPVVPR